MCYYELSWNKDKKEKEIFLENLAPVVLFTYNRLEHTKKTIEKLKKNIYAGNTDLYIYSDAPKNDTEKECVMAVRAYLHTVTGFKDIKIIERKENKEHNGVAENIIDGITQVINCYGKAIILEDDIITSPYFLKFMNDALTVYEKNEKVMAVSGFCAVDDRTYTCGEIFFLPYFECWGWGTWASSWKYFKRDPKELYEYYMMNEEKSKNDWIYYGGAFEEIKKNYTGERNNWDLFFFEAILKHNGLVAYSSLEHSHNIGIDGTGTNCDDNDVYNNCSLADKPEDKFPKIPVINRKMEKQVINFIKENIISPSIYKRITKLYKRKGMLGVIKKIMNKIK